MTRKRTVKTPEMVRAEFLRSGQSFAEWARQHGFSRHLVCMVLAGRAQGRRGKSHQIAVLLGLKEGEIVR